MSPLVGETESHPSLSDIPYLYGTEKTWFPRLATMNRISAGFPGCGTPTVHNEFGIFSAPLSCINITLGQPMCTSASGIQPDSIDSTGRIEVFVTSSANTGQQRVFLFLK
ncbi:hypothetical protein COCMIDRAFT_27215 [Bipolaris oryzae ATCC 44560]|uniref:Uncharacterized protein n=1 Tax=Bipolaris oryzae ATCC 44560 TaxID=930090 RepID=W6ZA62_COCMI|nr:uncharacterized protein COCMIDRAFT_27215 [Bipolaris oryzae ATCC 44560]EUC44424.1 hypothetical protein COCMIDRAFT_27215 [Bipolaris oryzae ATCC 44560]